MQHAVLESARRQIRFRPSIASGVTGCKNPRHCLILLQAMASSVNMTQSAGPRRLVLWFRNDLRLLDNYIVHEAVQKIKAKEFDDVVPLYCFDPRFFKTSKWGHQKTGSFRAKFLLECAENLKASLKAVGSDLLVTVGQPEDIISGVVQGTSACMVLTQQEVTSEELSVDAKVARAIKTNKGELRKLWGSTLYHEEDVAGPSGALGAQGIWGMPDVFTPFKEKVERKGLVRKEVPAPKSGELPLPPRSAPMAAPLPGDTQQVVTSENLAVHFATFPEWNMLPWQKGAAPSLPKDDKRAALEFKGGEDVALARLKYYLWDKQLLSTYFETRNGMLGGDYSTKLAPWLAAGCISPRTVYHQIKKYEAQVEANKSTYWVIFELIWRDFFRFFALKHGNSIFFEGGTSGQMLMWNQDSELWQRWKEGKTGLPLVDANMRELAATGFMSNRGRQNVASYLVLDIGVDWRRGADYFEHVLLDYDVCSNWGNWVAMAGLTGGRVNHFNITKQAKDYDIDGDYVRHWLPELRNVPAARIHEPWLMSKEEQAKYGVQIGVDYPNPIHSSKLGKPHGGGGGGGGYRPSSGSGRGGSSQGSYSSNGSRSGRPESGRPTTTRGGARQFSKKSEFERFG